MIQIKFLIDYNKVIKMLMQDSHSQNNPNSDYSSKRSSSQKIDMLYAEFQNLKSRINKSTSKRKQGFSNNSSLMGNQTHQRNSSNLTKQYKSREMHSQKLLEKSQAALNNTSQFFKMGEQETNKLSIEMVQIKYLIRKNLESFISNHLSKFENETLLKIEKLQRKLKISEETIKKVKTILNIKKIKRQKLTKFEPGSVKFSNEALCDVVLQYQKKIAELVEDYEQRMEIAEQKGRDKQTYSSTVKSRQINNSHEKQIMQKQTEINKLKLNYHKLKRNYEQTKDKYENCLLKIEELEYKAFMKKEESVQVEMQSLKTNLVNGQDVQCLKQQILLKDAEIERLHDIISKTQQRKCKEQPNYINEFNQLTRKVEEDPQSFIPVTQVQEKKADQQFYTQLEQIEADLSIFNEKFTKSQIIQPRRKKYMLESLKSLEVEVNLISEQNKHLQSKKVLFENQLKNTELDEERFVQQSNLFKDEIKRLNSSLQLLDKLVCQFVKDGKIDPSKVQDLPQDLKAKSLFSDFGKQNQRKK